MEDERRLPLLADDAEPSAEAAALRQQIAATKREIRNLVGVLSGGVTSEAITNALVGKEAHLADLRRRLAGLETESTAIDVDQVAEMLHHLGGGVAVLNQATDEERRDLYEALGVRIDFDARGMK